MDKRENLDRRDYLRMAVEVELRYATAEGAWRHGRTRNLSATGILFEADQPLAPGQVLWLVISPTDERLPPLEAEATVIRTDEEGEGCFVVAAEMQVKR